MSLKFWNNILGNRFVSWHERARQITVDYQMKCLPLLRHTRKANIHPQNTFSHYNSIEMVKKKKFSAFVETNYLKLNVHDEEMGSMSLPAGSILCPET